MANHLTRRGGIWWARLVVPEHLRGLAGRREFVQSCRTHEIQIAKMVAASLVATWRQQLLALCFAPMKLDVLKLIEKSPTLSVRGFLTLDDAAATIGMRRSDLLEFASSYSLKLYYRLSNVPGHILSLDLLDVDDPSASADDRTYVVPSHADMPSGAVEKHHSGPLPIAGSKQVANVILAQRLDRVEVALFDFPEIAGKVFSPSSMLTIEVKDIVLRKEALEIVRMRLAKDVTPEQIQHARELSLARKSGNQGSGKGAGKLFSDAVKEYCTVSDGLPETLISITEQRQRMAGILLFSEFMGDMPLGEIDSDMLREFRNGPLRTLLAKSNHLPKAIRELPVKDRAASLTAAGLDWQTMSVEMQNERMQWIYRFFHWAHDSRKWINADPAAPLRGESGRSKEERKQLKREKEEKAKADDSGDKSENGFRVFVEDELTQIFSQTQYRTGNGLHVKKPSYWYPFEYWIPLLGLYTGCRIKEACQLHLSDITLKSGIWCFEINETTPDKSLKNSRSERTIPIHPRLIELGFLQYCDRLKREGYRRVFPDLTWAETDAKYAKEPIRKMSSMLLKLGMPRDNRRVFHNFRHNLNDELSRIPMEILPYADVNLRYIIRHLILGHIPGDTVNVKNYSSVTVKEMHALLAGVQYHLPEIAPFDVEYGVAQVLISLSKKKGSRQGREDMGPLNAAIYGSD